jgi:hypothetical protein
LIDENVRADLRELDMGEPGVLQSFIDGSGAVPEHVALHQALAAGDGGTVAQGRPSAQGYRGQRGGQVLMAARGERVNRCTSNRRLLFDRTAT